MKKFIAVLLSFILMLGVLPATASGDTPRPFIGFMDSFYWSANRVEFFARVHDQGRTLDEVTFIAALYRDGIFVSSDVTITPANRQNSFFARVTTNLPNERAGYTLKLFVWGDRMTPIQNGYFSHTFTPPPSGSGTANAPFLLSIPEHLEWINGSPERLDAHYLVVNDIVAPDNLVIGYGVLVGDSDRRFNGIFDGGGHKITVNTNLPGTMGSGLFNVIGIYGEVSNLIVAGNVAGGFGAGGLTGFNSGTIQNVAVTADVTANISNFQLRPAGGIAGYNSGVIFNSYVTGDISGHGDVGGIVGWNSGTVSNTYFIGYLSGIFGIGGIAGYGSDGNISNNVALNSNISSIYDLYGRVFAYTFGIAVNNRARSDMRINDEPFTGTGTLTNQHGADVSIEDIHTQIFWQTTMEWDFDEVWIWNPKTNLPILRNIRGEQNHTLQFATSNIPVGAGTEADPFLLSTPEHLTWINGDVERLSANFVLMNDIVAPQNLVIGNTGLFNGTFDGNGHTITVNIELDERNDVGLFGLIGSGGIVRNLKVTGNVTGWGDVGGLVGDNRGLIENVSVVASITSVGTWHAGGIVGVNFGTITNSYFIGDVTGTFDIGGIAGRNWGRITNTYAAGTVNGESGTGGIAGLDGMGYGIKNSVALNLEINTSAADGFHGRIWANYRPDNPGDNNNHARNDMLINDQPFDGIGTATNQHGADVSIENIHTQAFWQTTMGWDFVNIWEWNSRTNLPVLRNIRGEQNHTLQ
ncbi:MAG: hypothetical protein FWE04_05990 [Oscillospiraceae bacterium]|nr:hypothetical protein [Oscillospiraceae bacterium]